MSAPANPMQAATAALSRGDFAQAEAILRDLVRSDPDDPEANFALATQLLRQGLSQEAAIHLDRCLAVRSTHPWALFFRCQLARNEPDLEVLSSLLARLVAAAGGSPDMLFEAGLGFFLLDSFGYASDCFNRVYAGIASHVEAGYWLAKCYQALGRTVEARNVLESVAPYAKTKQPHLLLAETYLELGDSKRARAKAHDTLRFDPDDSTAHSVLARALTVQKEPVRAASEWSKAAAGASRPSEVFLTQGVVLQSQGDFEGATAAYRAAVELEPHDGRAYSFLSLVKRATPEDVPWIEQTERALHDLARTDESRRYFRFALGKLHHDLKDYETAWRHYAQGNALIRKVVFGDVPYDPAPHRQLVDDMVAAFSSDRLCGRPVLCPTQRPVFVFGMIRSGTTLLEQVVSSHPDVSGAGELAFWRGVWQGCFDTETRTVKHDALRAATQEYDRLLEAYGHGAKRVTDKNPANYMGAGLLHYAMPDAKLVCVRRKPIDVAMSIWMTDMRTDAGFLGEQAGIVQALGECARINDFWERVLPPDRYHTVYYEDLVLDREAVTRRLIDFLELRWDDRVLTPQDNVRDVLTPSFWQVRQKVYTSSIDRWKPYEPWLGEFGMLLEA